MFIPNYFEESLFLSLDIVEEQDQQSPTHTIRTFRMTHAGCDRGTRPNISKPEAVIYRDERAGKSYKRGPFLGKVCRICRFLSLARYVGCIAIFPWQGI